MQSFSCVYSMLIIKWKFKKTKDTNRPPMSVLVVLLCTKNKNCIFDMTSVFNIEFLSHAHVFVSFDCMTCVHTVTLCEFNFLYCFV